MTEELLGAAGDPLDPKLVTPVVAWLASSEVDVTGEIYSVAGGLVAPLLHRAHPRLLQPGPHRRGRPRPLGRDPRRGRLHRARRPQRRAPEDLPDRHRPTPSGSTCGIGRRGAASGARVDTRVTADRRRVPHRTSTAPRLCVVAVAPASTAMLDVGRDSTTNSTSVTGPRRRAVRGRRRARCDELGHRRCRRRSSPLTSWPSVGCGRPRSQTRRHDADVVGAARTLPNRGRTAADAQYAGSRRREPTHHPGVGAEPRSTVEHLQRVMAPSRTSARRCKARPASRLIGSGALTSTDREPRDSLAPTARSADVRVQERSIERLTAVAVEPQLTVE